MDPILGTGLLCGFDPTLRPVVPLPPPMSYDVPAEGPLLTHDSSWPHLHETEHFAIRWGDEGAAPAEAIEGIGRDLELAWDHQVEALGWVRPRGTDTHRVDVFFGNTHTAGPGIDFDGAYVTVGLDMLPYIVVSPAVVDAYGGRGEASSTAVMYHEFNHTLQLGDELYDGDRGAFWFEASANWASASTGGEDVEVSSWGPFLLHPELAVYTFASIDDFSEPERYQRQYQAAMFVRYLSDHFGDDLIRRSWDEVESGIASPIPWLDEQLDDGVRAIYADFAATHAVGDHPYARAYSEGARQQAYFSANVGVTKHLDIEGGAGSIEDALLPEAFGWNRLAWTALEQGTVTFRHDPASEGSAGSTPGWLNTAVVERRGAFSYTPFDREVTLDVEAGDFVSFVLTSVPERHVDRETFGYSYDLAVEAEPTKGGCACAASPDTSWTRVWRRR